MGHPVSDTQQLYIHVGNYGQIEMTSILEQAIDHFDMPDLTIHNVIVSPENLKVTGCSCCYDSSDYQLYLCITLQDIH